MIEFETYDEFETWRERQEARTEAWIAKFFFTIYQADRLTVQYIDVRRYPEKMTEEPAVELNADDVDAAVRSALENEARAIEWSKLYECCAVGGPHDGAWYLVPQVLNIYYDSDKRIKPFAKFYMRVIMSDDETDERYLSRPDSYLLNVVGIDVPSPDDDDVDDYGRRLVWAEFAPDFLQ